MQVLAKYGEGPHYAGLTLLPLALLAVWRAARERGFPTLFAAAALLAAIPLTNWLSAFSLAISAGLLLVGGVGRERVPLWAGARGRGAGVFAGVLLADADASCGRSRSTGRPTRSGTSSGSGRRCCWRERRSA